VKINLPCAFGSRPLNVLSRAWRLPTCLDTSKLASNKRPLKKDVKHAGPGAAGAGAIGADPVLAELQSRVVASPQGHGNDVRKIAEALVLVELLVVRAGHWIVPLHQHSPVEIPVRAPQPVSSSSVNAESRARIRIGRMAPGCEGTISIPFTNGLLFNEGANSKCNMPSSPGCMSRKTLMSAVLLPEASLITSKYRISSLLLARTLKTRVDSPPPRHIVFAVNHLGEVEPHLIDALF